MNGAHPFAPGVIERHPRRSGLVAAYQRRALLRWLVRTALFMFAVAVCGFAAGLITGALS